MTCTEPIRLNSAAATEFEPLGVSDHPPANERSEAEGAAVSTAYQVNSSFYAYCSGMGTGLTFSVVRYGFADSRFALGVLGVGSGSKRPKLLGVALLCRAAPAAGAFDAPHLRIRHRLPGRIPCGNVSHTRKALRDLLLVAFAVDADRCASVLGSLLAHKAR